MSLRASSSKALATVALLAALGNALSFISIQLSPIVPSIPLGPISFSLALDLSHIATFIASLLGGPVIGGFTGLIGGFVAAFQFGFSQGNIVTGIGLPLGKAMTGVVAGILFRKLKTGGWRTIVVTVTSYIPEAIFTAVLFIYFYPILYGLPQVVATLIGTQIVIKAFVEMVIMGILLTVIVGSRGFKGLIQTLAP